MKKIKTACDLKTCLMCRLCEKEWLPAIGAHRANFKADKGELLFEEGSEMAGIYFVYEGTVKVHKHWSADKELIVRFAKKGDIVGHRALGKDLLYPVSGTAMEPVTVCFVDFSFFKATLKINHNFLYELMLFYATELKESERNMRNLAHMPAKGRVVQALLTLDEKFGRTETGFLNLSLNRQDLASFAGTTYETVFRIINELIEGGLIQTDGKSIALINKEALQQYVNSLQIV